MNAIVDVKLTYFKPSGKYYSEGTDKIEADVHTWLRSLTVIPGLMGIHKGPILVEYSHEDTGTEGVPFLFSHKKGIVS